MHTKNGEESHEQLKSHGCTKQDLEILYPMQCVCRDDAPETKYNQSSVLHHKTVIWEL